MDVTTTTHLPVFIRAIAPYIEHYGYLAIATGITIESFGVPSPGETLLIAGAVFSGLGKLNLIVVMVVGFLAAVIGDSIGFVIGRVGGRRFVLKVGRFVWITDARLAKAERAYARHGGKIVAIARFIEGLRQLNGVLAGISVMTWPRFLAFNALGAALWVVVWASIGYLAGNNIGVISAQIGRIELVALVALVIAGGVWALRARRKHAHEEAAKPGGPR